ncbi:MAG TPA: M36 family metallopeptidase, partial [Nevskiaceae bacterium]|nr:M36 family metallopeptidase [Nevskiaceae bacterium]
MNRFVTTRLALAGLLASAASAAFASTPASHDVTAPVIDGASVVVEWTGTALPGATGQGSTGGIADPAASVPCPPAGPDDAHTINLTVPDGAYDAVNVTAEFHLEWDGTTPDPTGTVSDPDLVLSVYDGPTALGSSDGGTPQENVTLNNPAGTAYTAIVCPYFASQPTAYRAKLTLTAHALAACLPAPTHAIAASIAPSSFGGVKDQERAGFANFDRFQKDVAAIAQPLPIDLQGRLASSQYDRRLGRPTFLWARTDAAPAALGALQPRDLLIEGARVHLRREARALHLSPQMIDEAEAFDAQFNGNGPAVVRFRQVVAGVPVHHRSLNVLLDRDYKPVAVSGYFASDYDVEAVAGATFTQGPRSAIVSAWKNLGGSLSLSTLSLGAKRSGWSLFNVLSVTGTHGFERAPRVRKTWYPRADTLEPAYEVELFAKERTHGQLIAYSFVVSATTGKVLHRQNLKANAAWSYRVFADDDGTLHQPHDSPLGDGYAPFPGADPTDVLVRTGIPSSLVTLDHAGIVTGDAWIADDATETVGNHVNACLDAVDLPSVGINIAVTNTCNPEIGDRRPTPTGAQAFDYAIAADGDPAQETAQNAAVVNLFYLNNWLHDWWYNHGFDEQAGNAQTSNYGRGGEENDPVLAQGQDASGRNNANMATPSDGASPTMQQYLFDGPVVGDVRTVTPIAGSALTFAAAAFGPTGYDIANAVVLADDGAGASPTDGCGVAPPDPTIPTLAAPPQPALAGKIALVDRGNCNFTAKAQFAMASGAAALIVVNNADGAPIVMGNGDIPVDAPLTPTDALYQIAAVMIRKADGQAIKDQLGGGVVTMRMQRTPATDVDGTLDNQIIAHEYFHYVHHRLTDSSNQQASAMSEGWGDVDAFMLTVRPDDRQVPGNRRFGGAYGLAGYVTNNFFSGIRRAPYSTDFTKNAFTLKHISDGEPTPDGADGASNSEVHSAGEIWANMMFECYVGILRDPRHRFAQAQARMQDYIIA